MTGVNAAVLLAVVGVLADASALIYGGWSDRALDPMERAKQLVQNM